MIHTLLTAIAGGIVGWIVRGIVEAGRGARWDRER
jgi:hypothetical protein